MGKLVTPKVYWLGMTEVDQDEVFKYLTDSGNEDFKSSFLEAKASGLSGAEILCSFYAKLCYKSLTLGKNPNISRIRDIRDNIIGCFDVGHGSIFEHINFNFLVTDCSRIFTHELVRHRIGTAFSQNSGRYVRLDDLDIVHDPLLDSVKDDIAEIQHYLESKYFDLVKKLRLDDIKDFTTKKKLTSALRRIAPNGQANEIGFSINLRALRHTILLRTNRHAEWEIRYVFAKLYHLVKAKYPLMFHGAVETMVDEITEVTDMKMQPYERTMDSYTTEELLAELDRRSTK